MSKKKLKKNIEAPKKQLTNQEFEELKDNFWDIKDPYPTIKTFAASLVQFCLYAVLASAGVYVRIIDANVAPGKFWILVCVGGVLSTIPVFMYRYKFVLIISFILCVALGVTSGNYAQSSKGVDIDAFYYVDLFAVFMTVLIGFVLLRKLANLSVKGPEINSNKKN